MELKLEVLRTENLPPAHTMVKVHASATVQDVALALLLVVQTNTAQATTKQNTTAQTTAARNYSLLLHNADDDGAGAGAGDRSSSSKRLLAHLSVLESGLKSGDTVSITNDLASAADPPGTGAILTAVSPTGASKRFTVAASGGSLGRSKSCDITVADPLVSKTHALVTVKDGAVTFHDVGSANGLLHGDRVVSQAALAQGESITIGATQIEVSAILGATDPPLKNTAENLLFNRPPVFRRSHEAAQFEVPQPPKPNQPASFPWFLMIAPVFMGAALFLVTKSIFSMLFIALSPLLMLSNYFNRKFGAKKQDRKKETQFGKRLKEVATEVKIAQKAEVTARKTEFVSVHKLAAAARRRAPLLWSAHPDNLQFLSINFGLGSARSRIRIKDPPSIESSASFKQQVQDFMRSHKDVGDVPIVESLAIANGISIIGASQSAVQAVNATLLSLACLHSPGELALVAFADDTAVKDFDWLKWLPHTSTASAILRTPALATSPKDCALLLASLNKHFINAEAKSAATQPITPPVTRQSLLDLAENKQLLEGTQTPLPFFVILLLGTPPLDLAVLTKLFKNAAGLALLNFSARLATVPALCKTLCEISASGQATVSYLQQGQEYSAVKPQQISSAEAQTVARALAPLHDASIPGSQNTVLEESVLLIDILGAETVLQPEIVLERWRQTESIHNPEGGDHKQRSRNATLRAAVGVTATQKLYLDLRSMGPHALVGGTTGAGKSEFLQSWVLSMAVEHSPDRVTFLFVDYKGGSAFADCVKLPHSVGLVTDLDPHLLQRALVSLKAEIKHREKLFNVKNHKDIISFERSGDPECPPVLIIVIDEFAALATQMPEFVDGVIDVAQRGRSLGIHLIMATQRPAGVIKDNLRANTNLRVALRMADAHDSIDVLGDRSAAQIPAEVAGRALFKSGSAAAIAFQTGFAGAPINQVSSPKATVQKFGFATTETLQEPSREATTTQPGRCSQHMSSLQPSCLEQVVETCNLAVQRANIKEPRKPWLPHLAVNYDLEELLREQNKTQALPNSGQIILGVEDLPTKQLQRTFVYNAHELGNILVLGGPSTGKTTFLKTFVASLAKQQALTHSHVYIVSCTAANLTMLGELKYVGAVVTNDDQEHTGRLFRMLAELVEKRKNLFKEHNVANIEEYLSLAAKPALPRTYLIINGFATFRSSYENLLFNPVFEIFVRLLSDGKTVGLHTVVTADRLGSLTAKLLSSFTQRLVFSLSDESEYFALGSSVRTFGVGPATGQAGSPVAGRCFNGEAEAQIAVFNDWEALAKSTLKGTDSVAPEVKTLPRAINYSSLQKGNTSDLSFAIADDNLEVVSVTARGSFMISGPPHSGKSNALHVLAKSFTEVFKDGTLIRIGPAHSSLTETIIWHKNLVEPEEIKEYCTAKILNSTEKGSAKETSSNISLPSPSSHKVLLAIENITDLLGSGAETEVLKLIKHLKRNNHFIVAEADNSSWMQTWPLLQEFKNARRGLALLPDHADGDLLFKTSLPRAGKTKNIVGRGYLVERGAVKKVQVALVDNWAVQNFKDLTIENHKNTPEGENNDIFRPNSRRSDLAS